MSAELTPAERGRMEHHEREYPNRVEIQHFALSTRSIGGRDRVVLSGPHSDPQTASTYARLTGGVTVARTKTISYEWIIGERP